MRVYFASLLGATAAAATSVPSLALQYEKLDLYLEGLAAFQDGASSLKAGDPLCLQQQGGRLACMTRSGTAVGLVPADKRAVLSRGPWSGTVRSVKRSASAAVATGVADAMGSSGSATDGSLGTGEGGGSREAAQQGSTAPASGPQPGAAQQEATHRAALHGRAAQAAGLQEAQLTVQQVLVRFTAQDQRWEQRRGELPLEQPQEEDTALLSQEQYRMLGGWMWVVGQREGSGCVEGRACGPVW